MANAGRLVLAVPEPPARLPVCRYVFMDGQRHSIPTRHSLVLCYLFGPIGLMSHMATRYFVTRRGAPWQSLPS